MVGRIGRYGVGKTGGERKLTKKGKDVGSPVRTPLPRASGISWGLHPHHGASIIIPDSLVPREVAVGVQARLEGAAEKRARGVKGTKDGGGTYFPSQRASRAHP